MNIGLRIFKDKDTLSHAAVKLFIELANEAEKTRGKFILALSGGGTPSGLYRLLATKPYQDQIAWDKTFVFWGDERCVPPDDPGSNYRQAMDTFLSRVPIPDENVQRIKGELEPAEASEDYAQALKRFAVPGLGWPRFDLVLLGMGEDGHTASLFPGSKVEASSPTLPVTGDYQCRPAQRVTLTPLVFNSARYVLFLVTGESKASPLKDVLHGPHKPEIYPAQRIRPTDGEVIWLVDEEAGGELPLVE